MIRNGVLSPRHSPLTALLRQLLEEGRDVQIEVTGASMTPFIRSGDLLTLSRRRLPVSALGDVVAVLWGETREHLYIHRVVGRCGGRLLTRGDAAPTADAPCAYDQVIATVVAIERDGRKVGWGIGPARALIALASRSGLLYRLRRLMASGGGRRAAAED